MPRVSIKKKKVDTTTIGKGEKLTSKKGLPNGFHPLSIQRKKKSKPGKGGNHVAPPAGAKK